MDCTETFQVGAETLTCVLMPGHDGAHWDDRGVYWSPQSGVVPLLGVFVSQGGSDE